MLFAIYKCVDHRLFVKRYAKSHIATYFKYIRLFVEVLYFVDMLFNSIATLAGNVYRIYLDGSVEMYVIVEVGRP